MLTKSLLFPLLLSLEYLYAFEKSNKNEIEIVTERVTEKKVSAENVHVFVEWMPSRIIGGTEAFPGQFVGQVSIQNRLGTHFCGGTLIHKRIVLTAAHCVVRDGKPVEPNLIQIMGDDISIAEPAGKNRQIRVGSKIEVYHKNIDEDNDIAIVKVSKPFENSNTFKPVNVAIAMPEDYSNCCVSGWGRTFESDTTPVTILRRTDVIIIPMSICNGSGSYGGSLMSGVLCAGAIDGGHDACIGDSGGGLLCDNHLVGIVSSGLGCGRPNFPGVYADAVEKYQWINETVAKNHGILIYPNIFVTVLLLILDFIMEAPSKV